MKPLSPLVLKILRLDHDGDTSEEIANEVKMSSEEVNKILGAYRTRFILNLLESRRQRESFLLDVYQGLPSKELSKKYKIREFIVVSIVSSDKIRTNTEKIKVRCNNCTNVMTFEKTLIPSCCPRCGVSFSQS